MFTGIVTDIGTVRDATPSQGGLGLTIACSYPDLAEGESVTDTFTATVTDDSEAVVLLSGVEGLERYRDRASAVRPVVVHHEPVAHVQHAPVVGERAGVGVRGRCGAR